MSAAKMFAEDFGQYSKSDVESFCRGYIKALYRARFNHRYRQTLKTFIRDWRIAKRYYFQEIPTKTIAKDVGVTTTRVQQIRTRFVRKVRGSIPHKDILFRSIPKSAPEKVIRYSLENCLKADSIIERQLPYTAKNNRFVSSLYRRWRFDNVDLMYLAFEVYGDYKKATKYAYNYTPYRSAHLLSKERYNRHIKHLLKLRFDKYEARARRFL